MYKSYGIGTRIYSINTRRQLTSLDGFLVLQFEAGMRKIGQRKNRNTKALRYGECSLSMSHGKRQKKKLEKNCKKLENFFSSTAL